MRFFLRPIAALVVGIAVAAFVSPACDAGAQSDSSDANGVKVHAIGESNPAR